MAIITDIKRQQKRDQFFSIFVDGKFSFSLSDLEVSTSGLRVGQELSGKQLGEFKRLASDSKAMGRAYRYLSFRKRSSHELRTYLVGKDYDADTIDRVMQRLVDNGLIDDVGFALDWVESRQALKSLSRRRLEQELRAKYIDKDIIAEVLGDLEPGSEEQSIVAVITKKRLQAKYPDRRQLIAYLGRQGFGFDAIKRALAQLELADN